MNLSDSQINWKYADWRYLFQLQYWLLLFWCLLIGPKKCWISHKVLITARSTSCQSLTFLQDQTGLFNPISRDSLFVFVWCCWEISFLMNFIFNECQQVLGTCCDVLCFHILDIVCAVQGIWDYHCFAVKISRYCWTTSRSIHGKPKLDQNQVSSTLLVCQLYHSLWQVLVRNVPPDPDESVSEHVEHFFCVNHPDHYLLNQVCVKAIAISDQMLFWLI